MTWMSRAGTDRWTVAERVVGAQETHFPFLPGHPARLHFPALFVIWWSHMTEFWPMECVLAVKKSTIERPEGRVETLFA